MVPTLRPGDRLLVGYGAVPRPGAVAVVRFADGTLAVKRIAYAATTGSGTLGWFVLSDNPEEGVDSRHRGALHDEAVQAVVLARVWPRPGRLAGPPG
jgi:hypothetical protein